MGPLLKLDTFTTAIIVSTRVRAIIIRRDLDEGVKIVTTLDEPIEELAVCVIIDFIDV